MEDLRKDLLHLWQESLGDPLVSDDHVSSEFFALFHRTSSEEKALQILDETLPVVAAEIRAELARGQ